MSTQEGVEMIRAIALILTLLANFILFVPFATADPESSVAELPSYAEMYSVGSYGCIQIWVSVCRVVRRTDVEGRTSNTYIDIDVPITMRSPKDVSGFEYQISDQEFEKFWNGAFKSKILLLKSEYFDSESTTADKGFFFRFIWLEGGVKRAKTIHIGGFSTSLQHDEKDTYQSAFKNLFNILSENKQDREKLGNPKIINHLLDAYLNIDDDLGRTDVLVGLSTLGFDTSFALNDKNYYLRANYLVGLLLSRICSHYSSFLRGLSDPDDMVRYYAIQGLGDCANEKNVDIARPILEALRKKYQKEDHIVYLKEPDGKYLKTNKEEKYQIGTFREAVIEALRKIDKIQSK
jgi:hypothetical protein